MLHISPIARPDRFLNEAMPFTAGTMNFALTSPELLDVDSYQRTLKRLITGLACMNNTVSTSVTTTAATTATTRTTGAPTLEVDLGAGGAFILDTSLVDHHTAPDSNNVIDDHRHQSYPLSFVASGQLPILKSQPITTSTSSTSSSSITAITTALPVLYYIRLPWNPQTDKIHCQLSARRLISHHVAILDRVLRRLCDASPGAFIAGYSDGLSGVDAGIEVVYSGENSRYAQHHHHHQQQQFTTARGGGGRRGSSLDQSIAIARDKGDMELDHRVASLVGHVDHHHHSHHHIIYHSLADTTVPPTTLLKKSAMARDLKTDTNTKQSQLHQPQQQRNTATSTITSTTTSVDVQDGSLAARALVERESDIVAYDFGLWEDDQLTTIHGSLDINHLHDALWVNS
ncbi:hypothetical protein BGX29_009707 [Mortierella sp. GBA35]|nr:hypothetical protein BGX29_009707 [Mortierella sp. GBA35]